jgi:hypothetical protein
MGTCIYSGIIDVSEPMTENEWEALSQQFKSPEPPRPVLNKHQYQINKFDKKNISNPINIIK